MKEQLLGGSIDITKNVQSLRMSILSVYEPEHTNHYISIQEAIINNIPNTDSWQSNITPSASSSIDKQPVSGLTDNQYELTGDYVFNTGWCNGESNPPNANESLWFQLDFTDPIDLNTLDLIEGLTWPGYSFSPRFIINANLYVSQDKTKYSLLKAIRNAPTDYTQVAVVRHYP